MRAGEKPRRLWACVFIGSALLVPVQMFFGWAGAFEGHPRLIQVLMSEPMQYAVGIALIVAGLLLVLGFAAGWERHVPEATDLPPGPGEPDATEGTEHADLAAAPAAGGPSPA